MSKAFSPIALHPSATLVEFAASRTRSWRLDLDSLEGEIAKAFDAIRECARMAWWDGSAIGLHLNGVLGLFETLDVGGDADRGDVP